MDRQEVIWMIRRNKNKKSEAITLISDFLVISREKAEQIYQEEFKSV